MIHWDKWAYKPIIIFTSSYVDVLLFLHYFGIVMLYLRNKEVKYVLEVIRTTDGESRFYNCGAESIQTAGAYVLSKVIKNKIFKLIYYFSIIAISHCTIRRSSTGAKVDWAM